MKRLSPRTRARRIFERLDPLYAELRCGLRFDTPLQLVMATILSAQCTDERVNSVTPALFERFPDAGAFADADGLEIEAMVQSCGFYRNKTRSIQGAAAAIRDRFGDTVPSTMVELITLPGVARKTANVVLHHAFGRNEGIAVDTHVQRLSHRLGLAVAEDPVKIERELMALVPRSRWGRFSDVLIWHGRKVCFARSPRCDLCVLADLCPSAGIGPVKSVPVGLTG